MNYLISLSSQTQNLGIAAVINIFCHICFKREAESAQGFSEYYFVSGELHEDEGLMFSFSQTVLLQKNPFSVLCGA